MRHKRYPILEYDPAKRAVIEPVEVFKPIEISRYCVLCFFKDIVDQVADAHNAKVVFEDKGVYGSTHFYQFEHKGEPIVCFQPLVGAPVSAAFLEIAIALGCRKFIACGGAGVLDREIPVGAFIVPSAAVRDEGLSYHYIPAGRQVDASQRAVDVLTSTLREHGESYQIARVWTTDGLFRETPEKVALRKREGCVAVEMEAAALFAVAQFRNVELGYLLFGGDDVSGDEWDRRAEISRVPARERLFWLSVEACLKL
jgi:uridine phosphorylase